jgi:hypothetical protein
VSARPTIHLAKPIERRSAKTGEVIDRVTELTLRPLTLGDLVAAMDASGGSKAGGTMSLHLAALSTGMTTTELSGLDLEDGSKVLQAIGDFMPAGLKTGTAG